MGVWLAVAHELEINEGALLASVARGDPDAVAAFHRRFLSRVYGFLYYRLGESAEDAEEVAQDVFLAAIGNAGRFRGQGSAVAWLYGIARHKAADFLRRRKRGRRCPESLLSYDDPDLQPLVDAESASGDGAADAAERREAGRQLRAILAKLPPDERDALILRYIEGFSVREIAAVLGRSEKATESLLTRSRRRAFTLGKEYFTDEMGQ